MIGDKLKEIRKSKNISQKDFAAVLKIPVSTLANYENNHREPNIETINKISTALGISPTALFQTQDFSTNEEQWSYIESKEFETITGAHVLKLILKEQNEVMMPFIKYINETYLKSKYNVSELINYNQDDLLNGYSNYEDLKFLLIDIIKIRLERYEKLNKKDNPPNNIS